jgi:hypothetical protein
MQISPDKAVCGGEISHGELVNIHLKPLPQIKYDEKIAESNLAIA